MPSPTSFVFPIAPNINAIQLLQSFPSISGPQKMSSHAQIPIPENVMGFRFVYKPKERPLLQANVASTTYSKFHIPTRQGGATQQLPKDQVRGLEHEARDNLTVLMNDHLQKSTSYSPLLDGTRHTHSIASLPSTNGDIIDLLKQSSTRRTSSRSITIRSKSHDLPITPPPSSPLFIKPERPKRSRSVRCTECRSKEVHCKDFEFCRLIMCGLCGPKHCLKSEAYPEDFECEHMVDQKDTMRDSPRSSFQKGKGPKKVVRWADRAVKHWLEEDEMETDPLPKAKKKKLESRELESESEYDAVSATESEEL